MARSFVVFALLALAFASYVLAGPDSVFTVPKNSICAFEGKPCESHDWTLAARSVAEAQHTVVFAIKMRPDAPQACDSLLMEISSPDSSSPRRGKHLSHKEVGELLTDWHNTAVVQNWLTSMSLPFETNSNGDFITVTSTVEKLEQALKAVFYDFTSARSSRVIRRTASFAVPSPVASALDFVGNTIFFPPATAGSFLTLKPSSGISGGNIAPKDLLTYYKIDSNTVQSNKATQALFEALGQDFSPADLTTFQNQFGLKKEAVVNVIGPNDPSQCTGNPNTCAEANLDVQYIMAIAQDAPTTYWSIDASAQDPFLNWIVALSGTANPPLVHSISYGSIAKEDPQQDMIRFNTEVCKLGLKGLTVMVSSGDDGVANFQARGNPSMCGFSPSFPATSPYVVAVGATQGPEFNQAEIACTSSAGGLITTGGGFSIYFARPSYQNNAVLGYLKNAPNLPPLSQFSSNGRGYPDISMAGHNYEVVIGGQTYVLSGTSASSPVFAGVISLINGQRFANGKGPVGFINPLLYKLGDSRSTVFRDVTVGENNCAAGNPPAITCCQYGFNATAGWDPLTGWGSIDYPSFSKALLSLIP